MGINSRSAVNYELQHFSDVTAKGNFLFIAFSSTVERLRVIAPCCNNYS